MFDISKNNTIDKGVYKILENKFLLIANNVTVINNKEHVKLINKQIELMGFLRKEYSDQSLFLIKNLQKQLELKTNTDIKTDNIQKELIQKFLNTDIKKILDEYKLIRNILLSELDTLKNNDFNKYKELLKSEKTQLDQFNKILTEDISLEKKFAEAYNSTKYIDYTEWMAKIKHRFSKFMTEKIGNKLDTLDPKKYKFKILTPEGTRNIPLSGPVIIAPRHYEAGIDSSTLFSAIPRRTFILCGVDWVQTGIQSFVSKMLYAGLGAIKINRESRPDSDKKIGPSPYYKQEATIRKALNQITFLLKSGEVIIIFPEGWANYGITQGTIIKKEGVLPSKDLLMLAIEQTQEESKEKIPVIPTGTIINHKEKTIQAVFGEPLYYEPNISETDKKAYRKAFGEDLMSKIKKLSQL